MLKLTNSAEALVSLRFPQLLGMTRIGVLKLLIRKNRSPLCGDFMIGHVAVRAAGAQLFCCNSSPLHCPGHQVQASGLCAAFLASGVFLSQWLRYLLRGDEEIY